jgi:hypothetical protein
MMAALVPPGSVYFPTTSVDNAGWLPGPILTGAFALALGLRTQRRCVDDLHRWYDLHHGKKSMD